MTAATPEGALDDKGGKIIVMAKSPGPCLSVSDWLARDIPAPEFLLGEWLSTTSRAMLVAPTGLGKTNFGLAAAFAISNGRSFLHWNGHRPASVLYIDGEMSRRLVKMRLADASRRTGTVPERLSMLCRDDLEEMPSLNTIEGQAFIDNLIKKISPVDFIIFDNVMSLIAGLMTDEEPWQQTMPWIKKLTKQSIGQLWVHHTGHAETHSFGTKTREWQLDTVILLERVTEDDSDIAFKLTFTKSRERAPHNRLDFEPAEVRLKNDEWTSDRAVGTTIGKKAPSPNAKKFYDALADAVVACGNARPESASCHSVTMEQWKAECVRLGLIDKASPDNRQRALISKYRLELVALDWVACNAELAWLRTPKK